ncbi:ThuA domain-containing protein [Cyclobacterium amurskyense]|uniref:Trehalose utilization n=1 Tax=Cyclobacterium amurskyense TaxID=320787 RepID=A0A0H4PQJ4_9BACT|nr:ThuA domain-containing protein [Cyclobacterium amurskyense]AKP50532.1 Trehalose utilization [Cyclobacterium amurskyense]|tara:strand:- start:6572 stop:7612 length:1041 start_codon:yes stop_codon:yes gene_type:complete
MNTKNQFKSNSLKVATLFIFTFILSASLTFAQGDKLLLQFKGENGAGQGKNVVLISGDDEYRSEEGLPMLAKILSKHHGFNTTVLFAINPENNQVVPNYKTNIPGMEHLEEADLVIILLRFRELPDEQMKYFDAYLKSGKPLIALRTSTHAFAYSKDNKSPYAKYHWQSKVPGWEKGFGKKILGETWVAHHGHHAVEGTRALLDGIQVSAKNPLLNGVADIWAASDVYTVTSLGEDAEVLIHGASTAGMNAEAPINWKKSLMPVVWTKSYQIEGGKKGKVFASTLGASIDLLSEDLRRLIVNASYWGLGMEEKIPEKAEVTIVGNYAPTMFGFDNFRHGMKVTDFE